MEQLIVTIGCIVIGVCIGRILINFIKAMKGG